MYISRLSTDLHTYMIYLSFVKYFLFEDWVTVKHLNGYDLKTHHMLIVVHWGLRWLVVMSKVADKIVSGDGLRPSSGWQF